MNYNELPLLTKLIYLLNRLAYLQEAARDRND